MPGEPSPAAPPDPGGAAPLPTAARLGRCPRCGHGALFHGLLAVRERCAVCGLDLCAQAAGDGPAVVLPLSVLTMRLAKAALIALQWRHRRSAEGV
jgi:uncharacterized protein (DUF983 family)